MPAVLVLDANQRSALAVTRSLGARGVHIHTADSVESSLAGASRYSAGYLRHEDLGELPLEDTVSRFIEPLTEYCAQHGIDLLFPMTEQTIAILLQHREHLTGIGLPFAGSDTIDRLADKCRLTELATSLSVPCPESVHVDPDAGAADLHSLDYPVVIKPGKSWLATASGWLHSTVSHAADADAAGDIIASSPELALHPYMIQQHVPGHGSGVFAIYDHGKPLAFFAHRRIHEKPPRGGISVICESVAVDDRLLEHSRRLLDAVQWHGVAMVEFRVDGDQAWLMEVNTRFWGSLQLSIDAGVDFPWMLYQLSRGQPPEAVEGYREGVRLRWLFGDLDWLYLVIKDSEFGLMKKLGAVLNFLFIAPFTSRHEINRLSDMAPFRLELRQYLAHVFRRH